MPPSDAQPGPSSTAPPIELGVARIGAYAAVGGAVIAVVAAAVGALIAGYYATSAADRQVAGAASQAQTDFLRTQRQSAYSTFLQDSGALQRAEASVGNAMGAPSRPSAPDFDALVKKVDDAFDKVNGDVSVVLIIGSPEAGDLMTKMQKVSTEKYSQIVGVQNLVDRGSDAQSLHVLVDNMDRGLVRTDQVDLEVAFVKQAQTDVQGG